MSYGELYNVVNRAWASLKEIQLVAQCGRKAAEHIRDNIKNDIINSGKKLPEGKAIVIPMKNLLEYLNLDLEYITQMAINEKKLNLASNRTDNYASISR